MRLLIFSEFDQMLWIHASQNPRPLWPTLPCHTGDCATVQNHQRRFQVCARIFRKFVEILGIDSFARFYALKNPAIEMETCRKSEKLNGDIKVVLDKRAGRSSSENGIE